MKATVLDLRYHTKDVLKAVEGGEIVTVLCRGKPKALIQPIPPGGPALNIVGRRSIWNVEGPQGPGECSGLRSETEKEALGSSIRM